MSGMQSNYSGTSKLVAIVFSLKSPNECLTISHFYFAGFFFFFGLFCFGFSILALAIAYLLNFDSPCHCFLLHTPLKVYTVNNVSVITKIRTEHLTEEEKKRYKGNLFPSPRPPPTPFLA